jgi:hypothetical protein
MIRISKLILLVLVAGIAGCALPAYTLVSVGPNAIADMRVQAGGGWNLAPAAFTPNARADAQTWTQDGPLLDRLVFIPGVSDGEALLNVKEESAALPVFRKDMLPNDLEELMESTIVKVFGEGNAAVSTSNLRPQMFGDNRGVMFDMQAKVTESPDYRGTVGAFIANEKLYLIYYLAAEPYYYGKHESAAKAIINSTQLVAAAPE